MGEIDDARGQAPDAGRDEAGDEEAAAALALEHAGAGRLQQQQRGAWRSERWRARPPTRATVNLRGSQAVLAAIFVRPSR